MSRWFWALLGGVVLVAIAAVFWIASNQTNVTLQVSPAQRLSPPAPAPLRHRAESRALASPQLRPRPRRRPQPRPPPLRPLPLPLRRPMRGSERPRRRLPRRPETPSAPPVVAQEPPPRLLPLRPPKRPCRRPRPDGRGRSPGRIRAQASRSWSGPGPIPRGIASGFSSGAAAAGPIGSRWTSSPRPRLSSRRRGSFCLPPSAGSTAHLKRKARSR